MDRASFENATAELERIHAAIQAEEPDNAAFQKRWAKARGPALEKLGWTEADYYAEVDRIGRARRAKTIGQWRG